MVAAIARRSSELLDVVDDYIVAFALHRKIAVDDLRRQQFLRDRPALEIGKDRPGFLIEQSLVLFIAQALLLKIPLAQEQRVGVDVREHLLQRNVFNLAPPPERR